MTQLHRQVQSSPNRGQIPTIRRFRGEHELDSPKIPPGVRKRIVLQRMNTQLLLFHAVFGGLRVVNGDRNPIFAGEDEGGQVERYL